MKHLLKIVIISILLSTTALISAQETNDEGIILENHLSTPDVILDELEDLGIVPSGAELVFAQNGLAFSGAEAQFSNFPNENDASNVVIGATLNLSPQADDLEFCAITTRTQRVESNRLEDGSNIVTIRLDTYVAVGVDSEGSIFTFEISDDAEIALLDNAVDLSEPVTLLAVVIEDTLTLFVNGEALITDYTLTLPAGSFAFLFSGLAEDSVCEAETFFAYTIADDLLGDCRVSTDSPINQRAGAGTDFARVGQLLAGESLLATGQTIGTDGFIWWQLEDNSWVRDDVVDTMGFCNRLPEVGV